ncbi:Hypothetical predicted protein [Pelobates cultripes]|uniref:Uncharacterized protein n=1 Tax=Pelobates cultripes TaxID=61616 RepID=A0AAD1RT04_PELCU|nr:Hypothetical predicted protein [Pelobates cultripes]
MQKIEVTAAGVNLTCLHICWCSRLPFAASHKQQDRSRISHKPRWWLHMFRVALALEVTRRDPQAAALGLTAIRGASASANNLEELNIEMMDDIPNIILYSPLPQRVRHDSTSKIAVIATCFEDHARSKMAASAQPAISTTKMAAATSNMATTLKVAAYYQTMPVELATGLPASVDMLINLIQNLRVEFRNDFKKEFDTIYSFMTDINLRTKDVEIRMTSQEQSHLELLEKIFLDSSAHTMRRRREFQPFTSELCRRGIRYRWGFPVKVLFYMDGQKCVVLSPDEGIKVLNSMSRRQVLSAHTLSPSTPEQPNWRSKLDSPH